MPTQSQPQSSSPAFAGIWVPLVTPFRGGHVDHLALQRLTLHCVQAGVAGFVACGSTGEAAALDDQEQAAVLATVLAAAQGRPVLMGLAGQHLGHTLERMQSLAAVRAGLAAPAGFLVPAPCYIRPSQAGLLQWFEVLADAAPLSLVLYDIPYRTGVEIAPATLLALAGHPRILAVKDCGGSPDKTRALIADGRLAVLAGNDAEIFATLCLGGAGAIAASALLQPALWVRLQRAVAAQQLHAARALWLQMAPVIELLFAEPNPAPLKAWLAHAGWMGGAAVDHSRGETGGAAPAGVAHDGVGMPGGMGSGMSSELRPPMAACSAPLRARLVAAATQLTGL